MNPKADAFLIELGCQRVRFTSPRRGEVDLRSKSGEGEMDYERP
jgi:hypothetical protein